MSKYIDQDKVLEYIIFGVVGKDITCGELKRAIESLPTIEIVRCKNCIYNTLNTDGVAESWCYKHGINIEVDDYCSSGERIDNE